MLKRFQVDNSVEDKILIGIITSDQFCREIAPSYNKIYFTTPLAQIVSKWAMDYYSLYKKAAADKIQDIFETESAKIKPEEAEIISVFLSRISSEFNSEKKINVQYLRDKTLLYFRKQALKKTLETTHSLLELDRVDEAEKELEKRKQIYKLTSGWINPFAEEEIKKFFINENNKTNELFQMDGEVGKLLGPFERGLLVAIFAPAKRGKTFWLQEMAIQALLFGLRVVFISLEMGDHRVQKRIYKRITALGDEEKKYIYPCFDCKRNQDNSCKKLQRKNREKLFAGTKVKPKYSDQMTYRPCTACRGTKDFLADSWYTTIERGKMNASKATLKLLAMGNVVKDNFWFLSYPAFSANLSTIKADLDVLEFSRDFIPDVIVLDYADILAPEDSRTTGRERIDETWKALKNISDSRYCNVITASQTNRGSFEKKNVIATDAAEDIRKIAHIDAGIALNQLPEEKRAGIMRVSLIAERDGGFDQYKSAMVLQQLSLGQANLDSELVIEIKEEKEENTKNEKINAKIR
jgi:hypothetical protein